MELDIYMENLKLAFEYQGWQHYEHSFQSGDPNVLQERDKEKIVACRHVSSYTYSFIKASS
jgi:hypothetical protein